MLVHGAMMTIRGIVGQMYQHKRNAKHSQSTGAQGTTLTNPPVLTAPTRGADQARLVTQHVDQTRQDQVTFHLHTRQSVTAVCTPRPRAPTLPHNQRVRHPAAHGTAAIAMSHQARLDVWRLELQESAMSGAWLTASMASTSHLGVTLSPSRYGTWPR